MKARTLDTSRRIELTGPWAGFGFQNDEFWTPENGSFRPSDFAWPSLTRNIVSSWQEIMALAREEHRIPQSAQTRYLSEVLTGARQRMLSAR